MSITGIIIKPPLQEPSLAAYRERPIQAGWHTLSVLAFLGDRLVTDILLPYQLGESDACQESSISSLVLNDSEWAFTVTKAAEPKTESAWPAS